MNQQSEERSYISDEIVTHMTHNKVLAFKDKLNAAPFTDYARIHAQGDAGEDGRRIYSTIGIFINDFSKGKGENSVVAEANISPAQARYIFWRTQAGFGGFEGQIFASTKIFGNPDQYGYCQVRKLSITRKTKDNNGKEMKSPWWVVVENGVGIKDFNSNGGSYMRSGSFKSHRMVFASLTDEDFYCYMSRVVAYIDLWEISNGIPLIKAGRAALEKARAEYAAEQANNPQGSQSSGTNGNYGHSNNYAPPPQQSHSQPPAQQGGQAQQTRQSSNHPQQSGNIMTLEQSRAVFVNFGKHNGKTLGQLEAEKFSELDWYVSKYHGNNEAVRSGAGIIIAAHNQKKAS